MKPNPNIPGTGEPRPNTQKPFKGAIRPVFTNATTGIRKVAFPFGDSQSLDLQQNGLRIESLLEFGALLLTREYQPGIAGHVTQTDKDGLELAIASGEDALEDILRGISAVNKSLAFSAKDLGTDDISQIGWLIAALSDLAVRVQYGVSEFTHEIGRDFGRDDSTQPEGRP